MNTASTSALTIDDLKIIRLALSKYPLSKQVCQTLYNVDAELAKHNLRAEYVRLPKRPGQRKAEGTYIFEPINK